MVNDMAKKKKSKETESKSFGYSVELTGLILVMIGLIGFGFGAVGALIKKFSMFLVGEWWFIILLTVLFLGLFMLIKRKLPNFFSSKLIGFYILLIVLLVSTHFEFIKQNESASNILNETFSNYMDRIASIAPSSGLFSSGASNIVIGGGIIGAAFAVICSTLFGEIGTIIVLVILTIFGFIMFLDITLSDVFSRISNGFKKMREQGNDEENPKEKLRNEEYASDTEDYLPVNRSDDGKTVIASMEELKQHSDAPQNQENIEVKEPVRINNAYKLPPVDILDKIKDKKVNSDDFTRSNKMILERTLADFGIAGKVVDLHVGPAVTQYEVAIPAGTKLNKIAGMSKELALALAAKDIRIQAPIPGKRTVGVEIPNPNISMVQLKEIMTTIPRSQENAKLLVCLGKDIMGRSQTADINKMPHLLVAGSTGSGKSVCINTFIISMLMHYKPDELKLVLVDPKKVELSNYNGVPHLLCPVVTDPKKANLVLQKTVSEMERRYEIFSETGVKNIAGYNEYLEKQNKKNPENPQSKMPYMVVIIDELADLMLVAAKEVEDSIMRITQMARAAGIHLIVATQRPSTDVITGVVKANIPSRISFAVSSYIDSRTILDAPGAEKLLGKGDMLYLPMGENVPMRIQGCYISDDEIARVIEYACKEQVAQYDEVMASDKPMNNMAGSSDIEEYDDPLYNEIVEFCVATGKISASLLQRKYRLGYNRAARVIDLLEERGIIGPATGSSKPREVLIKLEKTEDE